MKHALIFSIFSISLLGLLSCNKQEASAPLEEGKSVQRSAIEFCLEPDAAMIAETKSATIAAEGAINNFQILVFNPNGMIDAYGSTTADKISIKISKADNMTCYAVVNSSEDLSTISSKSALLAKMSYLKNNSLSGLEMIGSVTKDMSAATTCSIPVTRYAAKVSINKITPAFTNTAHQGMEFKIVSMYLINVNGQCPYSQTPGTLSWYNQLKYVSGDCNALISEQGINKVITASSPLTTPHYFYCYANPTTTDTEGGTSFTARPTRLVIETTLGGTTYYYPITIVGKSNTLNCNTSYEVTNLKITGLGSSSPDVTPKKGSISFTVKATDWTTGFSKEVEY